eukprot:13394638-Alexandrium_andersonii.AAC.1
MPLIIPFATTSSSSACSLDPNGREHRFSFHPARPRPGGSASSCAENSFNFHPARPRPEGRRHFAR